MRCAYFTSSDNHSENNARSANRLVAEMIHEAVYAEEVGLHSVWVGEHHSSTLGILSCPYLALRAARPETSADAQLRACRIHADFDRL